MDLKTRLIHSGHDKKKFFGASSVPVFQISTYHQQDPEKVSEYYYSRSGNPTRDALETAIAELEGGTDAFAFASGVAAMSSVVMLFKPGDHIVCSQDVYGGTYRMLTSIFEKWGLSTTFVDSTDLGAVEDAITPATKGIIVETPSNPILKITDLAGIVRIARKHGLCTITDNTFMSPLLQKPLELGFDIVVHSATKFISGHSDVIAGLVVTADSELGNRLRDIQSALGAILGPQDCWLTMRGLKTLGVRLPAQQATAGKIANWLLTRPEVRMVFYPGLQSHPGHDLHLRQSKGAGAVLSFELPSQKSALDFLRAVRIPLVAVSLGGVESILSYPVKMSHATMPKECRERLGITSSLIRLSVGLESPEDLISDLGQALEKVHFVKKKMPVAI